MFGKGDYFEAAGTYDDPPLRFDTTLDDDQALNTRAVGTYVRPRLLHGWRGAKALARVTQLASTVAQFAFASLNAADMALDIAVGVELYQGGHPRWAVTCFVITLVSLLLSVGMLLVERRCVTLHAPVSATRTNSWAVLFHRCIPAIFQCFSLGGVYSAFLLLLDDEENGVAMDVGNPSPLIGKNAVAQLKTLEAVVESAPQMVLQLYIALWLGYTSTLARSLLISVASLAVSMAMGDRAAVAAHAAQRLHKAVTFPLGVDMVKHQDDGDGAAAGYTDLATVDRSANAAQTGSTKPKPKPRSSPCCCRIYVKGRSLLRRFKLCGSRYHVMLTPDFLVVVLFRLVEIGARLGAAALLFLAVGPMAFIGLALVLGGSAVWWFGGQVLLWALPRDVREAAYSLREGPRHATVTNTLGALVYSSIAFPGIVLRGDEKKAAGLESNGAGQAASTGQKAVEAGDKGRREVTMLSVDMWMSGLWTAGWSLSPVAFCCLRTMEHAIALVLV